MCNDLIRYLIRAAGELGVEAIRITQHRKSMELSGVMPGIGPVRVFFCISVSDAVRARRNAVADLRRACRGERSQFVTKTREVCHV